MEKFRLNNLPGYGKVFVGVFTALMLAVCFWAMFIVYIELFEEMEERFLYKESNLLLLLSSSFSRDSILFFSMLI